MAKISARGEREHLRFEGAGGAIAVLTVKKDGKPGRLLHRLGSGYGYMLVRSYRGDRTLKSASDDAREFAAVRNYDRAAVRR